MIKGIRNTFLQKNLFLENELTLLRFVAIFLITNSHLNEFYPSRLFATGGSLGNSIFFFISAIGLVLSLEKKNVEFFKWYKKRFFRLYPPVWIVLLGDIIIFHHLLETTSIITYFSAFDSYWFIPALAIFYIFLYIIFHYYTDKRIKILFFSLGIIYLIWYLFFVDKSYFSIENAWSIKILFYFIVFIFGIYIAKNYKKVTYHNKNDIYIFIFLSIFYYGMKLFFHFFSFYQLQFLLHISTIFWLYYFLKVLKNKAIQNIIYSNKNIKMFIFIVSSITLEIYILQGKIIHLSIWDNYSFPLNIILFWAVMIPIAFIFHIVYEKIISYLVKIKFKY